jgi:rubredoxin
MSEKWYECSKCGGTWYEDVDYDPKCPYCGDGHVSVIEDEEEPVVEPVFEQIFHAFGF